VKLDERLDEKARSRIEGLQKQLEAEHETNARDAVLKEIAAVVTAIESYELMEETETLDDRLAPDALGNSETWQDVLRLQREGTEPQVFTQITCPVLMLQGAFDPHPGKRTHDLLRRFIPQIEYLEFEKCGHHPWRERHARNSFFNVLRKWLRQAPTPQDHQKVERTSH
jgi:pimeloyl-ACP methyl ester carboxylesterase